MIPVESKAADPVTIEDPSNMNLLGLLMRNVLLAHFTNPRLASRAASLKGDVAVRAGMMAVTLRFSPGRCVVLRGSPPHPVASVTGAMSSLLDVVLRRRMVRAFLTGRIRIGGNPFFLLKILPFMAEPKGGAA